MRTFLCSFFRSFFGVAYEAPKEYVYILPQKPPLWTSCPYNFFLPSLSCEKPFRGVRSISSGHACNQMHLRPSPKPSAARSQPTLAISQNWLPPHIKARVHLRQPEGLNNLTWGTQSTRLWRRHRYSYGDCIDIAMTTRSTQL